MKMAEIDAAFGVGESTGQSRSSTIRKILNISQLDPRWTLPSRMDDNPFIWLLEVNGLMMDIRQAPTRSPGNRFPEGIDSVYSRGMEGAFRLMRQSRELTAAELVDRSPLGVSAARVR